MNNQITLKGLLFIPRLFTPATEPWQEEVFSWPMLGSPIPTLTISAIYLIFFTQIGPKMMKDRKPFNLKTTIFVYNILMILMNIYIFVTSIYHARNYSLTCQPFDPSSAGMPMNWTMYLYFLTKFVDLLDTLFFLLSGKLGHLSTLHLVHHSIMPIFVLWGMKIGPNGHGFFSATTNSFIHIIMYSYYSLSTIPAMRPYLWWKKYLTQMQMVQFMVLFIHMDQILFNGCDYSQEPAYLGTALMVLFLVLFGQFYIKSYREKKVRSPESTERVSYSEDEPLKVNGKIKVNPFLPPCFPSQHKKAS